MALIAYDDVDAAAFEETRHLRDDDLATWRAAIGRHFEPRTGARLLDLGWGTGSWARAFRTWWPGVEVLAVEPSAAMRERAMFQRVLKPGAPVLIRSAFAGRHEAINLFRFFPEAVAVLDRYPSIPGVEAAFATVGFATTGCEPVPQVTAPSLADAAAALQREAHTPLQLISDEAYAAGVVRLQEAARTESGPVVDALNLLVLR